MATVIVLYAERHAAGTEITTLGDSAFWTTGQLLTVSSQLRNPISTVGRVVDLVLELYSITVITTVAGMFGAFFHGRTRQRHEAAAGEAAPS
jgi:hypothetical protein